MESIDSHLAKSVIVSIISVLTSFLILFSNNQIIIFLGSDDLRLMPEGTYCYYVTATNENDKTYTLPAKILKEDKNGQYFVEKIYFNNGGYVYFEEGSYVDFDETFRECDHSKDEIWEIELTPNKATHSNVPDLISIDIWSIFFTIIKLTIVNLCTILYIKKKYNEALLDKKYSNK